MKVSLWPIMDTHDLKTDATAVSILASGHSFLTDLRALSYTVWGTGEAAVVNRQGREVSKQTIEC